VCCGDHHCCVVVVVVQTAAEHVVHREVEALLTPADAKDLQPLLGLLACSLVARSAGEPSFYAPRTLRTLVSTHCLCHRLVKIGCVRVCVLACVRNVHKKIF